ncbi:tRNA lysidine(34) synthetase TilS [Leptolyngbya sp. FACHB-711]|uniref:tRNA lysidine(34) synthetase TilS n=1 Tax=unclassified Leptolyngbya TaxID=2650499 RepID=UPI0016845EA1|nr:tRNA lysidine(34) synthetase TilS [Cyanobacteria bacterium FACHB-502]MBD2025181.1 tRNA lysidine(34) synthetase TilS [Leptolyngbya sp. FACHB-711]
MSDAVWSRFHARLHQTLRDRSLLPAHRSVLVAVSGGQDSLCLIQLLLDLQSHWNWRLGIAHCNHRWRSDSDANADHVKQCAETWQISYHSATATEPLKSEAAARNWRYQALIEIAQQHGYGYLVTGHTASDRAETLLHNLLRGSGTDGLQALSWQRELLPDLWLVRPLLKFTRAETALFCQAQGLKIWEDTTNHDLKFKRNRIRGELIPYLQTHFNPQVEFTLAQTAELLQTDVDYLETAAADLLQQSLDHLESSEQGNQRRSIDQIPPFPRLNRIVLRSAPLSLQRRAMRQLLQSFLPQAPSFDQIEKLVALITAPNRSRTDPFPGGTIAQVNHESIIFVGQSPPILGDLGG